MFKRARDVGGQHIDVVAQQPTPVARVRPGDLEPPRGPGAVGGDEVVITYEIPGPARSTTSRGSTLDREPAAAGSLLTEATTSSRYETGLKVSDLAEGDHIYTVAATIDGRIVSGSTIFTIPAV